MRRLGFGLAAALALMCASAAMAAPRAQVIGVQDRTLREQIERAIGDEKSAPANRIEARRRAQQAADSAVALLRTEGYYDYNVQPDIGEGDRPQPIVRIDPGPRTRFGPSTITWIGTEPSPDVKAAASKAVDLKPGAPARAPEVIAAEGRIVAVLQQHGYADAQAAPREVVVDHADQTMRPDFKIDSGALVRLDGIRLENKGRTRASWVAKLVPWKPGDVYAPDKVAELERRLRETEVYDSVTVALAPAPTAEGERPVVVSLADRARRALEFGAGYSTTEGPDADIRWSVFNRLGRADTLTFLTRIGQIESRIGPTLSLPDWWRPDQTLSVTADVFRNVTDAYTATGAEGVVDLTRRYGRTSFFTRGFSVQYAEIDDKKLGAEDIIFVRPLVAFALDRTDNTLDPTRGWKVDARAEPIGAFGDVNLFYLKLQAQTSRYFALDPNGDTVIAGRLQVGSIIGGKIPQVPALDRFFAGGGGTVRGYGYQTVGPHYADNTPKGGLSLVDTSIELRRRLFGPFGGVVFLDTGAVGAQVTPDFSHLATAVGVGFRYSLGFAPLRADFAFPLNKINGAGQAPFQVYLSIGQSF